MKGFSRLVVRNTLVLGTLLFALFSPHAFAEKFVAKVKIKLVDPASITAKENQTNVTVPLNKHSQGKCVLQARTGELAGQACAQGNSGVSLFEIGGNKHQSVAIKVGPDKLARSEYTFHPTLHNGTDSDSQFQLSDTTHTVAIGGSVHTNHQKTHQNNQTPSLPTHSDSTYSIEVLYP